MNFYFHFIITVFVLFLNTFAYAQDIPSAVSLDEKLENLGRLYKDDTNNLVQEFWVLGRYHGQYHYSEGNRGEDDGYESRRIRAGFQGRFFRNLTVHAQSISGSDFNPTYNGFTELWLQWSFSKSFQLTVGQQKHRFTHDRNVSSRYLNYLERAMLTNMFAADYTPAITLQGQGESLNYYTGVFSNATEKDMINSFSEYDSGYSLLFASYVNVGEYISTDTAQLHFSYVYSNANEEATNLNRFDSGLSSALILTQSSFSFISEFLAGFDDDQGNAVGINVQPGVFLLDEVQLVGRYQAVYSNDSNGLRPQSRYEREAGVVPGDFYQAVYTGIDYYLLKHRCKLMFGVEYANMSGEYVWTGSTMLRVFFGPHSGGAFPMNVMLPGRFFEYD